MVAALNPKEFVRVREAFVNLERGYIVAAGALLRRDDPAIARMLKTQPELFEPIAPTERGA
jgi:hypothetical protein